MIELAGHPQLYRHPSNNQSGLKRFSCFRQERQHAHKHEIDPHAPEIKRFQPAKLDQVSHSLWPRNTPDPSAMS